MNTRSITTHTVLHILSLCLVMYTFIYRRRRLNSKRYRRVVEHDLIV